MGLCPNPHFDIKITQRSKGQSAVAGAAYQSGEKLFSEYDQKYKNYTRKEGILYTKIMLPTNAPPEYANRETLWNSVENAEKQWNSQLARRLVFALPREVPMELYPKMVKEYCEEHFVSKGMCCDIAIHDPEPKGNNPHCHVMLTMRAIDENGKWLAKSRKIYDLDENGERIRLPSGNWKSHKENTVDWNEQYHAEEWRHGWEVMQNKYLEMAGSPERVSLRSYERQGLDIAPTVHMGPAVTQMELRGILTNIGNLNRDIQSANNPMKSIRKTIHILKEWIAEIIETQKENQSPNLVDLLNDYMDLRKTERSHWSRFGQQKGTTEDLKAVSQAMIVLKSQELFTLEDLDVTLVEMKGKASAISTEMKKMEKHMKVITGIQKAVTECETHKTIHDKYMKIGWKSAKAVYAEAHKTELEAYNKAFRYLKKQGVEPSVDFKVLQNEYNTLQKRYAEQEQKLLAIQTELKPLKDIRYWVDKVLTSEQKEIEKIQEPKHSITEKMKYYKEQTKGKQIEEIQIAKDKREKKQNKEI